MKKNRMMRLASTLLVAVLITTSTISGTYAKYVTEDSAGDAARVAKFGVVVSADGTLFSETYVDKAHGNVPGASDLTVESIGGVGDKVVAPGTKNDTGMTFKVTGTPEVKVKVTVKITDNADAPIKDVFLKAGDYPDMTTGDVVPFNFTGDDYYPIVYTLKNGTGDILATGNLATIADYLDDLTDVYPANTNLDTVLGGNADGTYKLTWEWAFGTEEEGVINLVDKKDTVLGDLAADKNMVIEKGKLALGNASYNLTEAMDGHYNLTTNFKVDIIVEQVD